MWMPKLGHLKAINGVILYALSVPSVQVPASQLIHPNKEPAAIRLWHDQLFAKPPKHGGVVAW
jgi:hypothetical protein